MTKLQYHCPSASRHFYSPHSLTVLSSCSLSRSLADCPQPLHHKSAEQAGAVL